MTDEQQIVDDVRKDHIDITSLMADDPRIAATMDSAFDWLRHYADAQHEENKKGEDAGKIHKGMTIAMVYPQISRPNEQSLAVQYKINEITGSAEDPLKDQKRFIPIKTEHNYKKRFDEFIEESTETGFQFMDGAILMGINGRIYTAGAEFLRDDYNPLQIPKGGHMRHTSAQAISKSLGVLRVFLLGEELNHIVTFENGMRGKTYHPGESDSSE